jgi:hypothetical protein
MKTIIRMKKMERKNSKEKKYWKKEMII